jgi:hypothetical protein
MNRHTTRLLGAAIAIGALLLIGVTAAFAANGSGTALFSRMMGRSGPGSIANGSGHGGMMNRSDPQHMMSGSGSGGMMGPYGHGGMMSGWGEVTTSSKSISIGQARQSVQRYVDQIGNKHLVIDEVIEFQRNFYAVVKDTSTGHGAFELLVNKVAGAVSLEFGPSMMWNTEYGMMSGGMGSMMGYRQPSGPMTVSMAKAEHIAQQWLAQHKPGATTEAPDQFPGYFTIHFLQNGKIAGMLSVNGYTSQVWFHSWHGDAIRVLELSG